MKKWMKKKILPTATGVVVLGVGVAVLSNATGLDNLFEPSDFEQFQNRYKADEYDYVAGDGENAELADQDQNSSDNAGNSDQTLQMADSQLLSDLAGGLNGMGMADGNSPLEENLNSYIISPDAQGTIGTVSGGSADGEAAVVQDLVPVIMIPEADQKMTVTRETQEIITTMV